MSTSLIVIVMFRIEEPPLASVAVMDTAYVPLLFAGEAMDNVAVFVPVRVSETNDGLLSNPNVTEVSSISVAVTGKVEVTRSVAVAIEGAPTTGGEFGVVTKSVLEKEDGPYVLEARIL